MTRFAALKEYLPSIGMVFATVLGVVYTALGDNILSLTETLTLVVSVCGAIATYIAPRLPGATWLKPALAGVTAAVVFLISALVDGVVSPQEWVMVIIQLFGGLGVVATNKHVPFYIPSGKPTRG